MIDLFKDTQDLSVLVVDDEPDVRQMEKEIFSFFFGKVDTAADGVEALEKLKKERYDILFTDLTMPKMDGLELSKRAKELRSNQRIIVISARDGVEYFLETIRLGVDGYLLKPLDKEHMLDTIKKVVSLVKAEKMIENYQENLKKELEKKTAELEKAYLIDSVTHLPNRQALIKELQKRKYGGGVYFDIDNFESVNLVYGYEKGDEVLRQIASFLKKFGKVYHLGGDKFFFLLDEFDKDFPYKLFESFRKEKFLNNIQLTATIGASDEEPLLKTAETVIKELKKTDRHSVGFYSKNLPTEILQKKVRKFLPLLNEALEKDEIEIYFQPILNIAENKIDRYEALVRFCDEGTLYPACEFIEVAKVSGLVTHIDKKVIEYCYEFFANKKEKVNINLDVTDLEDENFCDFLREIEKKTGMDPSRVTFEILESMDIKSSTLEKKIAQLHDMGYTIAIDDFGSQNSNFERIHNINAEIIKIDGKYIEDIDVNKKSYEIVRSIVSFSKNLGLKIVAEFVSSKEIFDIVKDLGIDFAQGWYIGKPSKELIK